MDRYKIIKKLDKLKAEHPEQKIIVETPKGSVELKIGDALIYKGICGEQVWIRLSVSMIILERLQSLISLKGNKSSVQ